MRARVFFFSGKEFNVCVLFTKHALLRYKVCILTNDQYGFINIDCCYE